MAESRLDVVINPSRAQSGARAVKGAIDSLKGSWIEVTAKAFAAEVAISRVWKMASAGADFEEGMDRLNIQMGKFHSTAQLMINDLKNISNNQLSNVQAMQLSSRAMMQGMNPDQIRVFTQAADLLGDVMGTDLNGAFETILQGLQTGRTQMLANIGVYVDLEKEVKDLAVSTNRTTDQITKQEKAAIGARAVIDQLGGTLDKFASGAVSDADRMKAIEVRFDDMTLAVGRFAKSLVIDAIDGWKKFSDFVNDPKNNPFRAAEQAIRESTPGNIDNPKTQEILGRSIIADAQGNLARKAAEPKPKAPGLDPKLRAIQVEGAADRMRAQIEAESASLILGQQHQAKLFGLDQQAGQQGVGAGVGVEAFLKAQQDAKLKELAIAGETQNKLLQLETETYKKRVALGFESTQEKFQLEESFKSKAQEINSEIAKITQEYANAQRESEAEQIVLRGQLQEQLGERMRDSMIAQFQIGEDLRHREQDDAQAYYSNLLKFQEAYGTSRENMMTTEYDLVRANLAKQLDVNQETAEKVLNAWRNNDHIHAAELLDGTKKTWDEITAIMMGAMADQRAVSEKFSDDFFEGFAKSMRKYVNDQSVFGLGIDQARRVAQGMEQGFGKFFFDAMEGRIQQFKDVVQGLTDFAKNIVSQLAGQLITNSILRGLTGAMPSFFGGGPIGGTVGPAGDVGGFALRAMGGISTFASGGIATRPMMRWAGGGLNLIGEGQYNEAYVPLPDGRTIPVTLKGMPYGNPSSMVSTMSMPVTVNVHNEVGGEVETTTSRGSDGNPQIDVYIKNVVKQGMRNGEFDQSMKQFGSKRQPVRR